MHTRACPRAHARAHRGGQLRRVESGYTFTVAAVVANGANAAFARYGALLRRRGLAAPKLPDPFLQRVAFATDNGAYFYYNAAGVAVLPPPAAALPAAVAELRRGSGLPFELVQLDGWWMDADTLAPSTSLFPNNSWNRLKSGLGNRTRFLLYKAFFTRQFPLFAELGIAPVQSDKGPWYPPPQDAHRLYAAAFARMEATTGALASYEVDFMSDHLLPTPGLANTTSGLPTFFRGIDAAAATAGVPTQWCMPTAGLVLASAALGSVTNARASVDYATEGSVVTNVSWNANLEIGASEKSSKMKSEWVIS